MEQAYIETLQNKRNELFNKMRQLEFEYNQILGQVQAFDYALTEAYSRLSIEIPKNTPISSPVERSIAPVPTAGRRMRLAPDKRKIYECLRDLKEAVTGEEVAKRTGLRERYVKQTLLKIYLYQKDKPYKDIGRDGEKYWLTEEGKKFLSIIPSKVESGLTKHELKEDDLSDLL